MCCYYSVDTENAAFCNFFKFALHLASVRFTLLFPINDVQGLSAKLSSVPSHGLKLFHLPSLRVASYACLLLVFNSLALHFLFEMC